MILEQPKPVDVHPLRFVDLSIPKTSLNEIRIRIHTCAICHTDLHIIEGEFDLPILPIIPGHQIIGIVDAIGSDVKRFKPGERVGVP